MGGLGGGGVLPIVVMQSKSGQKPVWKFCYPLFAFLFFFFGGGGGCVVRIIRSIDSCEIRPSSTISLLSIIPIPAILFLSYLPFPCEVISETVNQY